MIERWIAPDAVIGEGLVYIGAQKVVEKGEAEGVLPVVFSKDNIAAAETHAYAKTFRKIMNGYRQDK